MAQQVLTKKLGLTTHPTDKVTEARNRSTKLFEDPVSVGALQVMEDLLHAMNINGTPTKKLPAKVGARKAK